VEYVIDASVAVKWFIPEPQSDRAEGLLRDFLRQRIFLTAPDVLVAEVGNTLWKRSARRGEIPIWQAKQSYVDFLRLKIPLQSSAEIAEKAFNLAAHENHPLYDAIYIVLAFERGCQFITADRILINRLQPKFPLIRWLGSP
jgi:predicted nucleic acid-binding protein